MRIDNKLTVRAISIVRTPRQVVELTNGVDLSSRNRIDRACIASNDYYVAAIGTTRR